MLSRYFGLILVSKSCQTLAESRAILARLRRRDLYRHVEVKVLPGIFKQLWQPHLTPDAIAQEATMIPIEEDDEETVLNASDIILDWATLHFGMKDRDPMQLVQFYGKHSRNSEWHPLR